MNGARRWPAGEGHAGRAAGGALPRARRRECNADRPNPCRDEQGLKAARGTPCFREIEEEVSSLRLGGAVEADSPRSAERYVRSINQECLSKLIQFGEASLRRALSEFIDHYHSERNHQGNRNLLLFPSRRTVHCRVRLGGLAALISSRFNL